MEAYREIIAGDKLAEVINLPEELKASELEVIILPIKKKKEKLKKKAESINVKNLPRHNMGKVLIPLDRESIYSDER